MEDDLNHNQNPVLKRPTQNYVMDGQGGCTHFVAVIAVNQRIVFPGNLVVLVRNFVRFHEFLLVVGIQRPLLS